MLGTEATESVQVISKPQQSCNKEYKEKQEIKVSSQSLI